MEFLMLGKYLLIPGILLLMMAVAWKLAENRPSLKDKPPSRFINAWNLLYASMTCIIISSALLCLLFWTT